MMERTHEHDSWSDAGDLDAIFRVSVTDVTAAIDRLIRGYKQGDRVIFGPARHKRIGCLLAKKATNKGRGKGYIKMKAGARRREFYAHHLVLLANGREMDLVKLHTKRNWQVSHRCHNRSCIESTHLVVEPRKVNLQRNDCRRRSRQCRHDPPCIFE